MREEENHESKGKQEDKGGRVQPGSQRRKKEHILSSLLGMPWFRCSGAMDFLGLQGLPPQVQRIGKSW
jgi:hypothetical protein